MYNQLKLKTGIMETTKQKIEKARNLFIAVNIALYQDIRNTLFVELGITALNFKNSLTENISFDFRIIGTNGDYIVIRGNSENKYFVDFFGLNQLSKEVNNELVIHENLTLNQLKKLAPDLVDDLRYFRLGN